MKINLNDLFNGSKSRIDIDYQADLNELDYGAYHPLKEPVTAKGALISKADVVTLELTISYTFCGVCDRCAEDFKSDRQIFVNRVVVEQLEDEADDDGYIIVSERVLDLDELINEEVVLDFPSKVLCKEDCKGLCSQCGANLNYGKCDCKKEVDPRLADLLQLLDE